MKALKSLVIGMGLLIVIGIALVGIGLSRGKQKAEPTVIVSGNPYETQVQVPRDSVPLEVIAAGDRIVLRYSDKLQVLDIRSGTLTGTITLVPETK